MLTAVKIVSCCYDGKPTIIMYIDRGTRPMQGCCQQQSVMLQKGQHTPTLLEEPYTFEALP